MPTNLDEIRRWNLAGGLLLVVLLSPVRAHFVPGVKDGFPLSHYPMFTEKRGPTTAIHHVVGRTAAGEEVLLPGRCLGAGGMNTVRRQLRRWATEGRTEDILDRVESNLPRCASLSGPLVELAVVVSHYPLEEATAEAPRPTHREQLEVRHLLTGSQDP